MNGLKNFKKDIFSNDDIERDDRPTAGQKTVKSFEVTTETKMTHSSRQKCLVSRNHSHIHIKVFTG